jgi:hypothetical protein
MMYRFSACSVKPMLVATRSKHLRMSMKFASGSSDKADIHDALQRAVSRESVHQLRRQGYAVVDDVFNADRCVEFRHEIEGVTMICIWCKKVDMMMR